VRDAFATFRGTSGDSSVGSPKSGRPINTVRDAYATLPAFSPETKPHEPPADSALKGSVPGRAALNAVREDYDVLPPKSTAKNVVRQDYEVLPQFPPEEVPSAPGPKSPVSSRAPPEPQRVEAPMPAPAPSAPTVLSSLDRWYRTTKDRLMREKLKAASEDRFQDAQGIKEQLDELEVEYEAKKSAESNGGGDSTSAETSAPPPTRAPRSDTLISGAPMTGDRRVASTVPITSSVGFTAPANQVAWGTFASKKGNTYVGTAELFKESHTVGSAANCDLRINDSAVGAHHCALLCQENTTDGVTDAFIEVAPTTSSLRVNGTVVTGRVKLANNDEISIVIERDGEARSDYFTYSTTDRRRRWKARQEVVKTLRGGAGGSTPSDAAPPERPARQSPSSGVEAYKQETIRRFEAGESASSAPSRVVPRVPMSREKILATLDSADDERDARENERLHNELAVLEDQLQVRKHANDKLREEIQLLVDEREALVSENKAVERFVT
jgi:FHA domain